MTTLNELVRPVPELKHVLEEVDRLIQLGLDWENKYESAIDLVDPSNKDSARNLIHYLAIRSQDLRPLQAQLSFLAISSLIHSEGYTLSNLLRIRENLLLRMGEGETKDAGRIQPPFDFFTSRNRLRKNANELFGRVPEEGRSHIMVTLPTEAHNQPELVEALMERGMNVARINTSHDDPLIWERMIIHIRRAEEKLGRQCLIYADLSGPKLRTVLPPLKKKKSGKKKDGFRLYTGDRIRICKTLNLEEPSGRKAVALSISTTLPEMFKDIQVGHRIYFDDGKIGGKVIQVEEEVITVEIIQAAQAGTKLKNEKGINLPDTHLSVSSLTERDRLHLPFLARNADLLGYSFVRKPEDVEELQVALKEFGAESTGIILKVETADAFENLPGLLLKGLQSERLGIMIARGDLAVEIGFERTAEVQEEIMWLCEAAHVPDIWATQVLESLAKKGLATRGEITDAAAAARAACVMLNKGDYILKAVETLSDILQRMQRHHDRKRGSLRPLSVASGLSKEL